MNNHKDSKAEILNKLGFDKGEIDKLDINIPYDKIFPQIHDTEEYFKENFIKFGGVLFEVETLNEALNKIKAQIQKRNLNHIYCFEPNFKEELEDVVNFNLDDAIDFESIQATITTCEALVSRTGSILISSKSNAGRRFNIIPNTHIVIAYKEQLFLDIIDGLNYMKEKYADNQPSMVSFVSGPSRTADIEKTLVMGAHGPKEILLFLVK